MSTMHTVLCKGNCEVIMSYTDHESLYILSNPCIAGILYSILQSCVENTRQGNL